MVLIINLLIMEQVIIIILTSNNLFGKHTCTKLHVFNYQRETMQINFLRTSQSQTVRTVGYTVG